MEHDGLALGLAPAPPLAVPAPLLPLLLPLPLLRPLLLRLPLLLLPCRGRPSVRVRRRRRSLRFGKDDPLALPAGPLLGGSGLVRLGPTAAVGLLVPAAGPGVVGLGGGLVNVWHGAGEARGKCDWPAWGRSGRQPRGGGALRCSAAARFCTADAAPG